MKRLLWLDDYRNPLENDWLVFSPIGRDVEVYVHLRDNQYTAFVVINGSKTEIKVFSESNKEYSPGECTTITKFKNNNYLIN